MIKAWAQGLPAVRARQGDMACLHGLTQCFLVGVFTLIIVLSKPRLCADTSGESKGGLWAAAVLPGAPVGALVAGPTLELVIPQLPAFYTVVVDQHPQRYSVLSHGADPQCPLEVQGKAWADLVLVRDSLPGPQVVPSHHVGERQGTPWVLPEGPWLHP